MAKLETETEKVSYALAMNISASVLQLPIEVDREMIINTVAELLRGKQPELGEKEYHEVMQSFQQKLQAKMQEKTKEIAKANLEEGQKFLAENAKKEGILSTASGLQYQVLKEGTGASPKAQDTVKVHYEGKLLNGTVFDSSIKRGQPAEFPLNQVIPGWTEGVQLMKAGSKYRFFIPSHLAYGERGAGELIAPNSTLIFDVELLEVKGK